MRFVSDVISACCDVINASNVDVQVVSDVISASNVDVRVVSDVISACCDAHVAPVAPQPSQHSTYL
jgi:hypothetical protein